MARITIPEKSFLKRIVPGAAFIGGWCCFILRVLVLAGFSSVSFAASLSFSTSLSERWYGQYKWLFRGAALLFLLVALVWYFFKKEGVCSLDAFQRKKRKIINLALLSLVSGIRADIVGSTLS